MQNIVSLCTVNTSQGVSVLQSSSQEALRPFLPHITEGNVRPSVIASALMVFRCRNYTQRNATQAKPMNPCLTCKARADLASYISNQMCFPHVACRVALLCFLSPTLLYCKNVNMIHSRHVHTQTKAINCFHPFTRRCVLTVTLEQTHSDYTVIKKYKK